MNCYFCKQPCKPANQFAYATIKREVCENHPCRVNYFSTGVFTFYFLFKGRKMKAVFERCGEKVSAEISFLFYDSCSDGPLLKNGKDTKLMKFDSEPGLTPENITNKVSTIISLIAFS